MSAGYTVNATTDIALTAATAKTILSVIAAADTPILLVEFSVSFDGVLSTAEPVLVELCKSTQATAGTSTSQTPVQIRGKTKTTLAAGARNFTAEPTVLTVIKEWLIHPQTSLPIQFPLGREPESDVSASTEAICLRCTAPANVNARGYLEFE